ncbi:TPA: hypothetical protein ACWYGP_003542 [Raoultella planticola]
MSKLTFVVEFEDGKEPPVHAHMEVLGGRVVTVAFRDALEEPVKSALDYGIYRYADAMQKIANGGD